MRARHRTIRSVLVPLTLTPFVLMAGAGAMMSAALTGPLLASPAQSGPTDLLPPMPPVAKPHTTKAKSAPAKTDAANSDAPPIDVPVAPSSATPATGTSNFEVEAPESLPVAHWTLADAQALLAAIRGIGAEGLYPRDYQPSALAAEISRGKAPISTPWPAACLSFWPRICAMGARR